MGRSPSIVPDTDDRDVYLVLDDVGRHGRCWRETDEEGTDRKTIVQDLLDRQYHNPARVITFNTAEGWSRDVSEEILADNDEGGRLHAERKATLIAPTTASVRVLHFPELAEKSDVKIAFNLSSDSERIVY